MFFYENMIPKNSKYQLNIYFTTNQLSYSISVKCYTYLVLLMTQSLINIIISTLLYFSIVAKAKFKLL